MISLLEVLQKSIRFLEEKGVKDAKLSAEWILARTLELKRLDLYLQFERPLIESELELIRQGIRRRSKREPLQHILGSVDFYGVSLRVDKRALIPRPETEYLIEILHTQYLNREPTRILDLGTGSGAIAIAMLNLFPQAQGVAVDMSTEALALAKENADAVGVSSRLEFVKSDWFQNVDGAFELIVANPPYLTQEEMETADPEVVQYEPKEALFGGEAGLDDLISIIDGCTDHLVDGGMIALETGIKQHQALMERAQSQGLKHLQSIKDLDRRDRFLIGSR